MLERGCIQAPVEGVCIQSPVDTGCIVVACNPLWKDVAWTCMSIAHNTQEIACKLSEKGLVLGFAHAQRGLHAKSSKKCFVMESHTDPKGLHVNPSKIGNALGLCATPKGSDANPSGKCHEKRLPFRKNLNSAGPINVLHQPPAI